MRGGFLPARLGDGFIARPGRFVEDDPTPSPGGDMTGVTQDATSLKYVPASLAEWQTTITAAGMDSATIVPSAIWGFQEASGSVADVLGAFPLTAASTPLYNQTITGWTRKGIAFDSISDGFTSADAALPNLGTQSHLLLLYVKVPSAAPPASRSFLAIGGSGARVSLNVNTTPVLDARSSAGTALGTLNPCDGAVHPMIVRCRRGTNESDCLTDAEKLSPTFSTPNGQGIIIGNGAFAAPSDCAVLYGASFHLSAAELTDAQIKTLLETLGFTVAW